MNNQVIALLMLGAVAPALLAKAAAMMVGDGNWGGAIGSLLLGPLLLFYLVHSIVHLGAWLVSRKALRSYSASRTNYVSLAITALALLGQTVTGQGGPA